MRKKLLAGVMALALCSTNMSPQTIFAGEFTSGNLEEVTEETPEIFSDDNQEVIEETEDELSVFSSESVPEFSNEANVMPATVNETKPIEIDLTNPTKSEYYNYDTNKLEIDIINGGGSYRFKGSGNINSPTTVPIRIRTSRETNIYLNNVYIVADLVPALDIQTYDIVNIYLENNNFLKTQNSNSYESALKMEFSLPTIYSQNNSGSLTVSSSSGTGIRIGSGSLTINGGSVTASSSSGTGIDIGSGSLTINGGSVTASSSSGTGIGSGSLTIKGGSVDASSLFGTGIENDSLTIKGGSVTASSTSGTGIKSNSLTIEDGSVKASSTHRTGIESGSLTIKGGSVTASSADETEKGISSNQITINGGSVKASSVSSSPKNTHGEDVYCCTIENPKSEAVIIDRNPTSWEPKNHQAVDPLYAWLTGETHTISVGNTTQTYYFDKKNNNKEFKPITNQDFTFTKPSNLTYDGTAQKAPLECKIEDIKDKITLSYYNKDDGQKSNEAINAGTYTVMANIAGNSFTDPDWTFTIKPRNLTILIDNKKRKYGEDNPKLTYLVSEQTSLAPNDTTDDLGITLTTDATKSSPITDANTSWLITMASYTNKNYNIQATSGTLTINPATFDKNSIKISAYNGTYDECEHPVINENSSYPDGSTVEYSTETGSSNWNTTCPKVKNVSDSKKTKVWIRISKDNYEPWFSGEIQATISPTKIANLPLDPQILVPWTCKKVADITTNLPTNWNWQDSSKDLQEGSNSVIAVYTGSDAGKGNYERETVTYTIIRSKCEHKHTAGRYYSSPSCTSSGYSGDTYCKDCNETISYGYTISAYGHDYDSGVITTEPTTETDGIITYTCKRCKYQDTKTLGKLGDGEPYIEGSFQKKGWDAVNDLIKASKEKDTISITLNGSRLLPASVLSGIKGKDISLNLDMENGFIWEINGTSITSETPADIDLSVTNTAEYIPEALYSLISTNQNDFGFHLGRSGAFDFPAVLSVKADASCAGLMANLFWYDAENGVLQCIQTVTVGGAFERSIPYADFTLSKGQDYFIAFGTESLNGRAIHTDGSITDENGAYLRPANTKISSHSIDRNKLTVKLSKGCAGAQGYDFVISKKSNMLQTGKFSKTVSSTGKPQASFRYLAKGTWYVAARSWVLDAQGNKVYGSWTKVKKIKITVVTPQQPKIKDITVKENTVTVTYTKCKNATGYEILLGNKYKTSAGEKYPVKKYVKRTEGKNTVTVTFTNVKKGTWYVTVRSWNKTSKDKSRVYSPYSDIKKFKVKK
ncbi:MBG domain-containing protein [Blautia sp.]